MEQIDIQKMWEIDHKVQIDVEVTDEEKKYYNKRYIEMLEIMHRDYVHWMYDTKKLY